MVTIETTEIENYKKGFTTAVILHLAIFGSFFLKNMIWSAPDFDYESAIRVDLVGLPDKVQTLPQKEEIKPEAAAPKPEVKPPEPAPEPVPEIKTAKPVIPEKTKDPEAINLDKTKSKQQAALDRLKSMSAIDKIKQDLENQKKKEAAAAAAPVKGNVLSAGTALTGLNQLQHENYVADLDKHIKENWTLPQWLANKNYKAQVLLKIDSKGQILSRQIAKSSGNPNYDEVAINTIDQSAPYPPPPEKFIKIVEVRGILIGFPE